MRKLFIGGVVFVSLLSGSASSVGATAVTKPSDSHAVVSVSHVKRQRDTIYHIRRNRITNRSNRPKVVVLRFNGRKEVEYQMQKHETVKVFGHDSKTALLNRTRAFFTKQHIKVTYSFKNRLSWKQSWMHITNK